MFYGAYTRQPPKQLVNRRAVRLDVRCARSTCAIDKLLVVVTLQRKKAEDFRGYNILLKKSKNKFR